VNIADCRRYIRIRYVSSLTEFVLVVTEVGLNFTGYTVNLKVMWIAVTVNCHVSVT
jgi:hypothetical protein